MNSYLLHRALGYQQNNRNSLALVGGQFRRIKTRNSTPHCKACLMQNSIRCTQCGAAVSLYSIEKSTVVKQHASHLFQFCLLNLYFKKLKEKIELINKLFSKNHTLGAFIRFGSNIRFRKTKWVFSIKILIQPVSLSKIV